MWQAACTETTETKWCYSRVGCTIESEGDLDAVTPLYELGVQGIFTKFLDTALLSRRIDIAVHSLKDVPTKLADGIRQAAVLERASYKDIFIYKDDLQVLSSELGVVNGHWSMVNEQTTIGSTSTTYHSPLTTHHSPPVRPAGGFTIATSSIRRMAQWLHRYPNHTIENLRGM